MASTYSTDLKLELMVTGENAGTWGTKTNTNLNLLQQSIAGVQGIDVSASDVTLVMSNAQLSNARNMVLVLNGSLTANRQVLIPDGIEKFYIIHDQTVRNGYSLTIKTVSGTGFAIETTAGASDMVACFSDGTDVYEVSLNTLSGSIAAAQLDSFAVTSTKLASFAVTSAKVASYAVTSNKLATNAVTAVKIANSTITLNKLSATGSPSASTYLRGDNTWGAISSSPTQLVQSLPLATGASYTAGQLASINASGEVVALPTLNTFGTTRTNSTTTGYAAISYDGSTALRYAITGGGNNWTVTFSGVVISNSANPINGSTTVSESYAQYGGQPGVYFISVGPSKFQVLISAYGNFNCGCGAYQVWRQRTFTINVDGSGNLTKGNVISNDGSSGSGGSLTTFGFSKITNSIIAYGLVATSGPNILRILTLSSTDTTTQTTDSDVQYWTAPNGSNQVLTTNNILGVAFNNTWRTATYTASPPAIGTHTDTTILGDYLSSGSWTRMSSSTDFAGEYLLGTYVDTNGISKYATFSINQTTGAITQVSTGNITVISSNSAGSMVYKDKNNFVGSNGSFSFTNGVPNSPAFNTPYSIETMRYNSGDLYYSFGTSILGYPTNIGYTVNAYGTNSFNYLGVVKTTDSTSPIDIVTDGVATGFTSLTPGTVYYATAPADGTITTSGSLLIGKAISATEILLQRSLTQ